MTKFFEQLMEIDKEKYIKDLNKSIDLETYPKVKDFILNNELYITNIKTNLIKIKEYNSSLILDNSKNRWFILCIDSKIKLIAKKNIIIHTNIFSYEKRNTSFNKVNKIKKADYLIEYIDKIGANLSLNIQNYNDKIGKLKWDDDFDEIKEMTLELPNKTSLTGYTYNGENFSLCIIGKGYDKKIDILK